MSERELTRGDAMTLRVERMRGRTRATRLTMLLIISAMFAVPMRMDAQAAGAPGIGIDHLILGVNDLDRGMAEFARRTGVTPVKGGVHPGRGTQNALASLSDGRYIEILAPSHEAGTTADARTAFATLTPVGWALHTTDLKRAVTAMRAAGFTVSEIHPGARARPDGVQLSWQTADVSGAGLDAAPFFIMWGAGTPHPSTQSPRGCTFRSASMTEPDPAPLMKFLATAGVKVAVAKADTPHMTIVLACPAGEVTFR